MSLLTSPLAHTLQKARKRLMLSPPSAEKDSQKKQKQKPSSENISRLVCAERGMDHSDSQPKVDTQELHTTILTRVNEALMNVGSAEKEQGGQNSLILQMVPAIVTAVSVAVGEAVDRILRQRLNDLETLQCSEQVMLAEKLQANCLQLRYQNDQLEQYSRRESVRVFGVVEGETESAEELDGKVSKIFSDCGASIQLDDISAMHRVGKKGAGRGPRPVLIRFVSRKKRRELMTKKSALKEKAQYSRVYINDDLTNLRSRLLKYVKGLDCVDKAWTSDGRILCVKKKPPGAPSTFRDRPVSVETPDDLFRLGVDTVDYDALGLSSLVLVK